MPEKEMTRELNKEIIFERKVDTIEHIFFTKHKILFLYHYNVSGSTRAATENFAYHSFIETSMSTYTNISSRFISK